MTNLLANSNKGRKRYLLLAQVACLFGFGIAGYCQPPDPASLPQSKIAAVRDADAITVLQTAVAAMGGANIAQMNSALVTGRIDAVPGTIAKSGTFTWKDQFGSSGYQCSINFQSDAGQSQVMASGKGHPARSVNGVKAKVPPHVMQGMPPFHLPIVILSMAITDIRYSVMLKSPTAVNGVATFHVLVVMKDNPASEAVTPQDWYLDAKTALPLRVEFRIPNLENALDYAKASADFFDYRRAGGVLVPFVLRSAADGVPNSVVTIKSVEWNAASSSTDFELPGGGR